MRIYSKIHSYNSSLVHFSILVISHFNLNKFFRTIHSFQFISKIINSYINFILSFFYITRESIHITDDITFALFGIHKKGVIHKNLHLQ